MKDFSKIFFSIMFLSVFSVFANTAFGDTIALKKGGELKGLIVEEYVDRIVLSTFEGEKIIERSGIDYILYEDEETRLMKLAQRALDTGEYERSIYYFREVLKSNPDSVPARDGINMAVGKRLGAGAEIAKEEVELITALEEGEAFFENRIEDNEKNIRELLGLELTFNEKEKACFVKNVLPGSVAFDYHIHKGDMISSIWDKSVNYMPYRDVIKNVVGPEFSKVKLGLEREIFFSRTALPDIEIGLRKEGYFIKRISGLSRDQRYLIANGDWLLEVNAVSTRYMPKKELQSIFRSGKELSLLIKRDLYLRREERR